MKTKELSLIDFNTLGTPLFAPHITLRYKKIAEMLQKEGSDILCLQEVATYYHLFLMKKLLPDYPYVVYKKYLFGPQGGLVIFSKLPVEHTLYINFSTLGKLENISFYTQLIKNGVLVCKLKNTPLTVMNTHLVTDFIFEWTPDNHLYSFVKAQVEEAATIFLRYKQKGQALIMTGDFNMGRKSKLYTYFHSTTGARDPFELDTFSTYYHTRIPYKFHGIRSDRIDFMFVDAGSHKVGFKKTAHIFEEKVSLNKKLTSYLSDHIGLRLDLKISP